MRSTSTLQQYEHGDTNIQPSYPMSSHITDLTNKSHSESLTQPLTSTMEDEVAYNTPHLLHPNSDDDEDGLGYDEEVYDNVHFPQHENWRDASTNQATHSNDEDDPNTTTSQIQNSVTLTREQSGISSISSSNNILPHPPVFISPNASEDEQEPNNLYLYDMELDAISRQKLYEKESNLAKKVTSTNSEDRRSTFHVLLPQFSSRTRLLRASNNASSVVSNSHSRVNTPSPTFLLSNIHKRQSADFNNNIDMTSYESCSSVSSSPRKFSAKSGLMEEQDYCVVDGVSLGINNNGNTMTVGKPIPLPPFFSNQNTSKSLQRSKTINLPHHSSTKSPLIHKRSTSLTPLAENSSMSNLLDADNHYLMTPTHLLNHRRTMSAPYNYGPSMYYKNDLVSECDDPALFSLVPTIPSYTNTRICISPDVERMDHMSSRGLNHFGSSSSIGSYSLQQQQQNHFTNTLTPSSSMKQKSHNHRRSRSNTSAYSSNSHDSHASYNSSHRSHRSNSPSTITTQSQSSMSPTRRTNNDHQRKTSSSSSSSRRKKRHSSNQQRVNGNGGVVDIHSATLSTFRKYTLPSTVDETRGVSKYQYSQSIHLMSPIANEDEEFEVCDTETPPRSKQEITIQTPTSISFPKLKKSKEKSGTTLQPLPTTTSVSHPITTSSTSTTKRVVFATSSPSSANNVKKKGSTSESKKSKTKKKKGCIIM